MAPGKRALEACSARLPAVPDPRGVTTICNVIPFDQDGSSARDPGRSVGGPGRAARLGRAGADDALLDELAERKLEVLRATQRRQRWERVAGWLIAPLCLSATVAAVLFIQRGPDHVFGVVFTGVLALGLAWILISSLFPGRADRRCPRCSRETLERLDRRSTRGLRCRSCGLVDAHSSSFLLAEDEGEQLEDIAMRDRTGRRF